MDDRGIHTTLVHQADRLCGYKGRYLPVRKIAGQAGSPEMNLGVNDLHPSYPLQ